MAYKNDYVTEEDVEKYELKKIAPYWMMQFINKRSRWTVDRENESFLIEERNNQNPYYEEGVPGHAIDFNVFYWEHTPIHFSVTIFGVRNPENQLPEIGWRLLKLDLPESLQGRRNEVLQALKEAYQSRGRGLDNAPANVFFEDWS